MNRPGRQSRTMSRGLAEHCPPLNRRSRRLSDQVWRNFGTRQGRKSERGRGQIVYRSEEGAVVGPEQRDAGRWMARREIEEDDTGGSVPG